MHFGRINSIDLVDFRIPPDTERTEKFLSLKRGHHTQVYIGCPVWATKGWQGSLYPTGTKPTEFLSVYASQFPTVEVNSTFYNLLLPERIRQWREKVPGHFKFCPKVFRGITEEVQSSEMPNLVGTFCEAISEFRENLGLTFAQFPEWFGPVQIHSLMKFVKAWPSEIPLAIELRHPDWFKNHSLQDDLINLFYKNKVSTVITDTPGRRDVLHLSLTQPKVLIRFQGNSGNETDLERIQQWIHRMKKWSAHQLNEIYFFVHQPDDLLIPETARYAFETFWEKPLPSQPVNAKKKQTELF